ncbi:MAG: 50S ribosomal protein L29 [Microgenomates group bacterium]
MKRKDLTDLKTKDLKDLKKMVLTKKDEALAAKVKRFSTQEKNLKSAKNLKIEIAKIMTIIREKEIMEEMQPKVVAKEETK